MPTKNRKNETETFDAVAESRKWKEMVAHTTSSMSAIERIAWFRSQSSVYAIRNRADMKSKELVETKSK
jgi:hypothetical protein